MNIHKTAIIDKDAQIGDNVEIGPYTIIEKNVKIANNVKIAPLVHICSNTEIGEGTKIYTGAVLGEDPQDIGFKGGETFLNIGKNNVIREHVTIHRGTEKGTSTIIGNNCFLMASSHVAHNVVVNDNAIIANGALLAGHVHIGKGAFISGNVVIHQFCHIGELVMIGGFTGVNKDIPPFLLVRGACAVAGLNIVGLRRSGMDSMARKKIKEAYRILYGSDLNTTQALEKIKKIEMCEELRSFIDFINTSKRGIAKTKYSGTDSILDKEL
ncbi:MAG: acyl-ACP--UDP-N-acetylglucosamine O-acyltransferase [Candidatus Omnitrophica bacterium]|nr:acyl-ACP--UDP-N-acetylglucosamine O-acyltransferase [Candidatus Omnitrophota bacterium]